MSSIAAARSASAMISYLPYGVADSSVCFAFIAISDILAQME